MAKTSAEIMQMLVDNNVKFVDLRFTDFKGKEQHVSVPVSAFDEDKFEEGHAFDGSSIAGWKGIEASDMLLMPDPDSARMDPFADEDIPTMILTCNVVEPSTGKGYDRDPKCANFLKNKAFRLKFIIMKSAAAASAKSAHCSAL